MTDAPDGAARARTPAGEDVLLVREEPLLIELGEDRLLTMRTPGADEDLAVGFLVSEGVIARASDVASVACGKKGDVDLVTVELRTGVVPIGRGRLSRAHEIRPSCGICGSADAEGLSKGLATLTTGWPRVSCARLLELEETMRARQALFHATGGAHAAALFGSQGDLIALGEDVGRHNAVDKALGRAVRAGRALGDTVLVLSGRGGFELVLKAFRVGVPIVASVSAPTSLAVEIAEEAGGTLVGFVRKGSVPRVYADDGRIG